MHSEISIEDIIAIIERVKAGTTTSQDADVLSVYLLPQDGTHTPVNAGEYVCETQVTSIAESRVRRVNVYDPITKQFETDGRRQPDRWWVPAPNMTRAELVEMDQ
jgi:hypothetical protein